MRVFKEEQRFNQWWLISICALAVMGIIWNFLSFEHPFKQFSALNIVCKIIGIGIGVGIFLVKMHTRIDKSGIKVWFSPFKFTKKSYRWKDIENAHTRKYRPFSEFGGWGIRVFRQHKAYNIKGDKGIQLKTKEGKFFLIGTQQTNNADRVINRYFKSSEE